MGSPSPRSPLPGEGDRIGPVEGGDVGAAALGTAARGTRAAPGACSATSAAATGDRVPDPPSRGDAAAGAEGPVKAWPSSDKRGSPPTARTTSEPRSATGTRTDRANEAYMRRLHSRARPVAPP